MNALNLKCVESMTYNPLIILAIPTITLVMFCKIWKESEVNFSKQLLDNASLGMYMRLAWNEGYIKHDAMWVEERLTEPEIWVMTYVSLGNKTYMRVMVW